MGKFELSQETKNKLEKLDILENANGGVTENSINDFIKRKNAILKNLYVDLELAENKNLYELGDVIRF